jgi:type I site-specific restriction endonuclease
MGLQQKQRGSSAMITYIYSEKEKQELLHKDLKEYEAMFDDMTAAERKALRKWVAESNSAGENPYLLYGDDGHPIGFIEAWRIGEEMAAHPGRFQYTDMVNAVGEDTLLDGEPF